MPFQQGLQRLAAEQAAPGFVIMEKGIMIEEEDRIIFGNEPQRFFDIGFEFFRKQPLGGIEICRESCIKGENPSLRLEGMDLEPVIFQREEFNGMGNRSPLV